MTPIEFGLLAGLNTLTIRNWEAQSGSLKIHKKSREALNYVSKLTKRKAWKEMEEL